MELLRIDDLIYSRQHYAKIVSGSHSLNEKVYPHRHEALNQSLLYKTLEPKHLSAAVAPGSDEDVLPRPLNANMIIITANCGQAQSGLSVHAGVPQSCLSDFWAIPKSVVQTNEVYGGGVIRRLATLVFIQDNTSQKTQISGLGEVEFKYQLDLKHGLVYHRTVLVIHVDSTTVTVSLILQK